MITLELSEAEVQKMVDAARSLSSVSFLLSPEDRGILAVIADKCETALLAQ